MSACETARQNIRDISAYVRKFPHEQQSAAVELLFSKAVSFVFHLPFYTSENDDQNILNRVVWNGHDEIAPVCGTNAGADTIVFARDFDILLEVTRLTGANQWKREFAPALRHLNEYLIQTRKSKDSVYLLLIAPEIHVDTFNSIRQKQIEENNIIPITFDNVEKIAEVCSLTVGLRHIDLKNLFGVLADNIRKIHDLQEYIAKSEKIILEWQRDFLRQSKLAFLGIKGYKVFKKKQAKILTASDIVTELNTQKDVQSYFKILGGLPERTDVIDGLLIFGFGCQQGLLEHDPILSIASELDIQKRMEEILDNIKQA
jgi:hypothetical protein